MLSLVLLVTVICYQQLTHSFSLALCMLEADKKFEKIQAHTSVHSHDT